MIISFSPQRREGTLSVSKSGDILTVNGMLIDLSGIPNGATLPARAIDSEWIAGPIERVDGVLHVTLTLPHGTKPSQAVAFPEPVVATGDGPITVPTIPCRRRGNHGDD